jgi:hypothetical protein
MTRRERWLLVRDALLLLAFLLLAAAAVWLAVARVV